MRERDAPGEFVAVGISCQDRPALSIVRRDDVPGLTLLWRPEHPIVIGKEAQRPRGSAVVCQGDERELHGCIGQILAPMSRAWICRQENDLLADGSFNPVRHFIAAFPLDVPPDFDKVDCGFRRKHVPPSHSGWAFSFAR